MPTFPTIRTLLVGLCDNHDLDISDVACVEGCGRKATARRLCNTHYVYMRRHGRLDEFPPMKLGQPFVNYHGYRVDHRPGHPLANKQGHVLEHRLVAWETFGPFDPRCHVHHKDEDKLNNDPSNLVVLTPTAHGEEHGTIDRAEARRLYETGMTTTAVAAALGTHPGNVSRIIRQAGGTARVAYRAHDDEIERRYLAGASKHSIAKALGISTWVVTRVVTERVTTA